MEKWKRRVRQLKLFFPEGQVTRVIGLTVEARGISASIGEICDIIVPGEPCPVRSEVVGFRDRSTLLMPLGELMGIHPGCKVVPRGKSLTVRVGPHLLGRVLDGLGVPMDWEEPRWDTGEEVTVDNAPPNPLARRRITEVLPTGIKAIDGLLTCGKGQRMGIFSGSGVGKSTLLGMIARYGSADVNVIGLVGERGREVREFIERDLGPEGLAKSVVVVATSDQPALVRLKAAFVASAIAEYFRDQGKDVMLMMDSITRFAMAQREVGLAVGEPPATRGYTPSVFALLPRLLERSGMGPRGSITAFYTVLVEADDMNDPIADTIRGILDGHIVLSRELASRAHYPAIDILESVSRLMPEIVPGEHYRKAMLVKEKMAVYKQSEDLINIGAYVRGTNPGIDEAIDCYGPVTGFLRQDMNQGFNFDETVEQLNDLGGGG
ncbi:MAG: flagellar protein export ATPase FliI [Peptococcaceae bacterium]|nr:flagellar protein export ATPase FliI [Peptococcaceae bacterium]